MLDYQNPPYLEADMPPAMAEDGKGDIVCSLLAHIISIYQRTRPAYPYTLSGLNILLLVFKIRVDSAYGFSS